MDCVYRYVGAPFAAPLPQGYHNRLLDRPTIRAGERKWGQIYLSGRPAAFGRLQPVVKRRKGQKQ
jgi:hypothetical protein